MRAPDKQSIKNLATSVFDNGRRGSPRPGCDCLQCFGYCITDRDKMQRELAEPVVGGSLREEVET
jgi:hypothetical protein